MAWYDNEWGYVNPMVELVQKVAAGIAPRAAEFPTELPGPSRLGEKRRSA